MIRSTGHDQAGGVKPMDAEQLERIRSARNNFERIATQASSDAGIMEVIISYLPPELRQRAIEFAEDLRSVSDGAAELVIQLDQVDGVGSRVRGNIKEGAMHAATRTYSGKVAVEIIDIIEKNKAEVERLIRSIDGIAGSSLFARIAAMSSLPLSPDPAP
jgi:hypothetical protein